MELLVPEPEPVLLHLVGPFELLPVADLQGEPHGGPAQLAGQKGRADLADELEGLLRLDDVVGAVDELLLLEHLAQQLGAAVGLQGEDLGRGRRAGTDSDAKASGLDLFARDVRIPERQDIARYGRAHTRRGLRLVRRRHVIGVKSGLSGVPGGT